jgi:hypothetical protein
LEYGAADAERRFALFIELGELLTRDRGYGFRVRDTETDQALLENWQAVLRWWMQAPAADGPAAANLRAWQRFVADNLEFRLGVAVGAVVARAWSDGAGDSLAVPSLAAWKETTNMPWFGFWARELLRWGTLEPFVAFALARGLAWTRDEAAARRPEFEEWLRAEFGEVNSEDLIDPQRFLAWQGSLPQRRRDATAANTITAELRGTTGERGLYRVLPILGEETVHWIDAAGYVLARSDREQWPFGGRLYRQDFALHTDGGEPFVDRTFAG